MPESSLTTRVTPIEAGAHVVFATFLARTPVLALADGTILFADPGEERRVTAHNDAGILVAASNGTRLITGGDDGLVIATDAQGATTQIADQKGQWIDALAIRADGAMAWAAGKNVTARDAQGALVTRTSTSTTRGIAYFPKGYRLALAQYNGASLWFPNTAAEPEFLEWKGSHLDIAVSPDARFVVTSMQESTLHGWRLADGRHMRMSGYPGKSRSLSWSGDGAWLATSGADGAIIWPFQTKDGPMGRSPRECGVRPQRVTCVAFHPKAPVVALGYADGFVMLCRMTDGAEILVRTDNASDGAVGALAWDRAGKRLLFGTSHGAAGILSLPE